MGRLAVILGSSATGPAGEDVAAVAERHAVVLQRHGAADAYVLPTASTTQPTCVRWPRPAATEIVARAAERARRLGIGSS